MPRYAMSEDGCRYDTREYDSTKKAIDSAAREVALGDYDPDSTIWVKVCVWEVDEDGDPVDGGEAAARTVALDPEEPECVDDEHDWQAPVEIVGGCEPNPGVWGNGGGVIITEVCARCGWYCVTDTWAQDPETGEQGLTSVRYEAPTSESLDWAEEQGAEV